MKRKWLFNTIAVALLIIIALLGLAKHDSVVAAQDEGKKIEGLLMDRFATDGDADFFVIMTEQADVSTSTLLSTKEKKGQYVYDTLVATADQSQADLLAYLDKQGVTYESFYIVNAVYVKGGNLELALSIATRPDVSEINANHTYQLEKPMINLDAPNAPTGVEPNISFVDAPEVWASGFTGQGTVMAGNDTGLAWDHPALKSKYRGCLNPPTCDQINHNYNWWDATGTYPNVPNDGHGHGTHTTGTMVGDDGGTNQIGMAPGARTVHCKNMTDGGGGSDNTFLTCFQWDLAPWDLSHSNPNPALAPDAINNSWGYSGGGVQAFRTAINNLQAAGILVEVSAGNEGSACTTLRSPGDYQNVLTTGSVNHTTAYPGLLTGFSSRGPSILDGNYFPDIMAPGENIRSSLPGGIYQAWSGTSMAGPHTTALVGLMWSACPALRGQVDITTQMITETAGPLNGQNGSNCGGNYTTGPNNDWGFGTINAQAAVQQAVIFCGGVETGHLDGFVTDTLGDPVVGATVSATPAIESGKIEAITDPVGYYTMTLVVGTYDVTASKVNYTSQTKTGVQIEPDVVTSQNFTLDYLGAWTQIVVTAPCPDWTRIDAEYFAGTGKAYILGGRGGGTGGTTYGDIYAFDPVTQTCADTGVNMPTPISNYTIVPLNDGNADLLCTFGGRDQAGNMTLVVQCFNPIANSVVTKANLPSAFSGFLPGGAAAVNNKAYIFGGFRSTSIPYNHAYTYEYDPVANAYTQRGNLGLGRVYIDVAVVDGMIYGFGGDICNDGVNLVPQTFAEVFNPGTGTWDDAAVADLPTASGEGRAYGFDNTSNYELAGKVVIAGGGEWPSSTSEVELYDVNTNSYDYSFANLNTARRNQAGFFVQGNPGVMWVYGGRAGADTPPYAPPEYYEVALTTEPEADYFYLPLVMR